MQLGMKSFVWYEIIVKNDYTQYQYEHEYDTVNMTEQLSFNQSVVGFLTRLCISVTPSLSIDQRLMATISQLRLFPGKEPIKRRVCSLDESLYSITMLIPQKEHTSCFMGRFLGNGLNFNFHLNDSTPILAPTLVDNSLNEMFCLECFECFLFESYCL